MAATPVTFPVAIDDDTNWIKVSETFELQNGALKVVGNITWNTLAILEIQIREYDLLGPEDDTEDAKYRASTVAINVSDGRDKIIPHVLEVQAADFGADFWFEMATIGAKYVRVFAKAKSGDNVDAILTALALSKVPVF